MSALTDYAKQLFAALKDIDQKRDEAIKAGDDASYADLSSSWLALEVVLGVLLFSGISSEALNRLQQALSGLIDGKSPPAMLRQRRSAGRHVADSFTAETIKGSLAGLMEFRIQHCAESRQSAAQWVLNHVSKDTLRLADKNVPGIKWSTVAKWRERFRKNNPGQGLRMFQKIIECGKDEIAKGDRPDAVALTLLRAIDNDIARGSPQGIAG